jgi:hypothetical protein
MSRVSKKRIKGGGDGSDPFMDVTPNEFAQYQRLCGFNKGKWQNAKVLRY